MDVPHQLAAGKKEVTDILKSTAGASKFVDSITEAQKRFDQHFGTIAELQRRMNETISATHGPIDRLQKAIEEAASRTSRFTSPIIEQMERFQAFYARHDAEFKRLNVWADSLTQTAFPKDFDKLRKLGAQHQRLIEQTQERIANYLGSPSSLTYLSAVIDGGTWRSEVLSETDGSDRDTFKTREFSDVEVATQLNELSASIAATTTSAELFSILLRYAKSFGIPTGLFLLLLFRDVLVNWTAAQLPSFDSLVTNSALPQRAAIKEVQQNGRIVLTDEQRDALRFISSPTLNVHVSSKMKSMTKGRLPFGTLVTVQQRMGDWMYCVYRDPLTRDEAEGWVLTRYVKRFEK
jgi:hypothetical protein